MANKKVQKRESAAEGATWIVLRRVGEKGDWLVLAGAAAYSNFRNRDGVLLIGPPEPLRKPSAPRWSCALLCLCTVRHDDGQTFAERTEHHSFYHTARPAACLLCMTIQSPQTPGHTATSSPEHTTKTSDLGARALADAGQRQRGSISLNAIVVIEKHLPSTST